MNINRLFEKKGLELLQAPEGKRISSKNREL